MNKKIYFFIIPFLLFIIFSNEKIILSQNLNLYNNVIDKIYQPDKELLVSSNYLNLNSYDIYNNSTMLLFSNKKSNLNFGYANISGKFDFRRPFEQEKQKNNIGFIDITYLIDTTQAIHSYIQFNDSYSIKRNSIFNIYPYRGNPYLLGDANSGDFDLQKLTFETDYSKKVSDFIIGAQLSYTVGNSVKKFFPKPTAKYLEIGGRISLGYNFSDNLIASIFGDYFRTYEEIRYEVSYTSPKIYKFRGLDYPFLLLGTSSLSRRNEDNGFGGGGQVKYTISDNSTFLISGKFLHNKEEATDGITTNPRLQGKWQENNGEGNVIYTHTFDDNEIRLGAVIEIDRQFASKPDLNESILKRRSYHYSAFAGFKYQLSNNLFLYTLYQFITSKLEVNDYINYIHYKIPSIQHSILLGWNYNLNEYFTLNLDYLVLLYKPKNEELNTREPAEYFYTYFLPEIEYYKTKYTINTLSLNIIYHYGILGDIGIKSKADLLKSDGKGSRNVLNFNLFINLFVF